MAKPKHVNAWAGFCDGKLDMREMDDKWGGSHHRMVPALSRSRKEAKVQYEDVRRVEIRLVRR